MKALRLALILSLAPLGGAVAGQCEDDLAIVDSALAASPAVETEELLRVQELRNEAAEDAAAGNKENCVVKLTEAKAILKVQ
ncbi:hypothetical protein [Denitrobaculum tricleocarpae]|uniref:Secreted protein n=1 Tax=Denitrobaculum tricleocarpae TaxID=2591009 RepID=A0A545TWQ5_9PROT|nr:hypothetical protein [Denitrobaculum tricleocarpae]TQV81649.1 hypothetical protein FKG95_05205 [Denitrobaculum tricleocarpae]